MEPPTPHPQCVGREFVRQYYTLLNQAPLHLHRYSISTLIKTRTYKLFFWGVIHYLFSLDVPGTILLHYRLEERIHFFLYTRQFLFLTISNKQAFIFVSQLNTAPFEPFNPDLFFAGFTTLNQVLCTVEQTGELRLKRSWDNNKYTRKLFNSISKTVMLK